MISQRPTRGDLRIQMGSSSPLPRWVRGLTTVILGGSDVQGEGDELAEAIKRALEGREHLVVQMNDGSVDTIS